MSLISKIFSGKNMIYVKDLVCENLETVRSAMRSEGIVGRTIQGKNGGLVIKMKGNVPCEFPGRTITPNSDVTMALKFDKDGNMLQLAAAQKTPSGYTASSTIRTADGVDALKAVGVENPTNYHQMYKGAFRTEVNTTSGPFGMSSELGEMEIDTRKAVAGVAGQTEKSWQTPWMQWERGGSETAEGIARAGRTAEAETVDLTSRGKFGQDLYDPLDWRNKDDISSPYYESPFSGNGSGSGLNDPFDKPFGNLF